MIRGQTSLVVERRSAKCRTGEKEGVQKMGPDEEHRRLQNLQCQENGGQSGCG